MFDRVLNTPLYNNDMSFENCQVFWFRLIWLRLIHQLLRLSQTFFSFLISIVERYHGLTWFINYTNISCLKYRNFLMQEFCRTHSFRRVSDDSTNTPKLPKLCVSSKLTRKSGEITLFFWSDSLSITVSELNDEKFNSTVNKTQQQFFIGFSVIWLIRQLLITEKTR